MKGDRESPCALRRQARGRPYQVAQNTQTYALVITCPVKVKSILKCWRAASAAMSRKGSNRSFVRKSMQATKLTCLALLATETPVDAAITASDVCNLRADLPFEGHRPRHELEAEAIADNGKVADTSACYHRRIERRFNAACRICPALVLQFYNSTSRSATGED